MRYTFEDLLARIREAGLFTDFLHRDVKAAARRGDITPEQEQILQEEMQKARGDGT